MIIYIASTKKHEGLIKEDIFIQNHFTEKGMSSKIRTLDYIVKNAQSLDVVILKSIWGYHLNHERFLTQVKTLQARSVSLINSYDFILWNIDKSKYIAELGEVVKIVPTYTINLKECKTQEEVRCVIRSVINFLQDDYFVIKPAISASGYLTFKYSKKEMVNSNILQILLNEKKNIFIIQPFREQIVNGEVSVVVIDGVCMYAFNRYPGVLEEKRDLKFINIESLDALIIKQIGKLIKFFQHKFGLSPRICRVDFVQCESGYELMEVELIDPDLFFKHLPKRVLKKTLLSMSIY